VTHEALTSWLSLFEFVGMYTENPVFPGPSLKQLSMSARAGLAAEAHFT